MQTYQGYKGYHVVDYHHILIGPEPSSALCNYKLYKSKLFHTIQCKLQILSNKCR